MTHEATTEKRFVAATKRHTAADELHGVQPRVRPHGECGDASLLLWTAMKEGLPGDTLRRVDRGSEPWWSPGLLGRD